MFCELPSSQLPLARRLEKVRNQVLLAPISDSRPLWFLKQPTSVTFLLGKAYIIFEVRLKSLYLFEVRLKSLYLFEVRPHVER